MTSEPTVFIVDDDPSMLKALARTVTAAGWNAQTYTSGEDFLDSYDPDQVGCLVLDLRMPHMSGLIVQEKLIERQSHLPIIFITAYGEVSTAVQAMRAGALDFLEKPFSQQALLERIKQAIEEDDRIRQAQADRERASACLARLTRRERDVLEMIIAGKLTREIAAQFGISPRTVEQHRRQIMQKMQANSVVDLARMMFSLQ
jgi:two-component system response regulator FixJ